MSSEPNSIVGNRASTAPLDIVDVHTHLWPLDWGLQGRHRQNFTLPDEVLRAVTSPETLLAELEAGGVALAVLSTTIESLFGVDGPVDPEVVSETNDWLGELVAKHPGRLSALGVVDFSAGPEAVQEAERALGQLQLAGLVIDSFRNGLFPGDARVWPVLEVAARHRVPVFVHPINAPQADILVSGAGKLGNSHGRGLMNGVAFLSILEGGVLDEFPDLDFVFATLGMGAIAQASRGGRYERDARQTRPRPNIYFDTMGDDPSIIRILAEFFGIDRVLAGTDWPILPALSQASLKRSLHIAGFGNEDRRLVAGGNARRILAKRKPS